MSLAISAKSRLIRRLPRLNRMTTISSASRSAVHMSKSRSKPMIDVAELLSDMSERDVRVSLDGDGLRVIAPTGTMTEVRVAFIRQHREAIIEFLRAKERDRVRVLVLLSEPRHDEPDNADATEGWSIVEAIKAVGGWVRIENERIVLRWHHDVMPGALIDRIRGNRIGVVAALHKATSPGQ